VGSEGAHGFGCWGHGVNTPLKHGYIAERVHCSGNPSKMPITYEYWNRTWSQ